MQWPIFVKLGMWVVLSASITHIVCCHQMCILNSSFAYVFWLVNNNKVKYPEVYGDCSDETCYVGATGLKYNPCVLLLSMYILSTSFAYLFWLADNNKVKYPEFYVGYSDET